MILADFDFGTEGGVSVTCSLGAVLQLQHSNTAKMRAT